MGGCCCCSSRRAQLNEPPVYFYCPRDLEDHGSLSSANATDSALSTGLLVDTSPDTYRAPPVPLPYDVDFGRPRALSGNKIGPMQAADSQSVGETISDSALKSSVACEDLKELGSKNQTDGLQGSPKVYEVEPSKLSDSIVPAMNEDVCPICLEEYDVENPRIITNCDHHFHLSCILEWMERSDTCAICDQKMVFDHTFGQ